MNARTRATRHTRAVEIVKVLRKLFPHPTVALRYGSPWELLVAVMLSAQCTDKKVNEVTARLFRKYRTLEAYCRASQTAFEQDIFQTGFYRQKAKHILATAKRIRDVYDGTVPSAMEDLLSLPGVARKTANVVRNAAFGLVDGIAVDTHVRRLTRRWGLTTSTDPKRIERELMEILPRSAWKDFTLQVIEYGRTYCPAKRHDHAACPIPDAR